MDDFSLKRTEEILTKYGLDVVQEMATYLSTTTNLKDKIKSEVSNGELSVIIPHYGLYVNDGRNAGTWPKISAISDWMVEKKIWQNRDVKYAKYTFNQSLFLISRSIHDNGIKPRKFFHYFYDKLDILYLDIAQSLGEEVVGILSDNLNRTN